MKILGVGRAPQFSPNSVDRDAAILQSVKEQLEQAGRHEVRLIDERDLTEEVLNENFDGLFHMARSRKALQRIAEAERRGVPVCNSAGSLLQLNRRGLLALCRQTAISVPDHWEANAPLEQPPLQGPLWMKRDDRTTQQADDVRFIDRPEQWAEAMSAVREQGIAHYILEQHIEGDLIKFYSVADTDFFHYSYPTGSGGFSKFGTEHINGRAQGFDFDAPALKRQVDGLAKAVGIPVYGGDAVVRPDGRYFLIDFNDWPSFSACRDRAARAIASHLLAVSRKKDKH